MSVVKFSTCRIQFKSNDRSTAERNYSDRTLLELRQYDFNDYSLRALDLENSNAKIFNIPLKKRNIYQLGTSVNNPDEVRGNNGTYRLYLSGESRQAFHETFRAICEVLFPDHSPMSSSSEEISDPDDSQEVFIPTMPRERLRSEAPEPVNCEAKDVLTNVHNLSQYIEKGDGERAARIAGQLAQQGIRLQTDSLKRLQNEEEFQINVQLDGNEYGIEQHGATLPIQVCQSTTVRELRAAFEIAYQYPPPSQYFFVNGILANDKSSMKDLKVGPNSLFVLFLMTHPKRFKNTGPWRCSSCGTQNQPKTNLKCNTCSASRTE